MNKRIFLSPPDVSKRELEYVKEAFESNYIAPAGPFIERFEKAICQYTNCGYAVAVSSGTAALHLALKILKIKQGDKVLASTFTFIGSVSPIIYQQGEPVFIDSDESWNISPDLVEDAIKKEKPKAMIITHLYGQPAKIEDLKYLSERYGVYLIEDAAESLGATYKNKHTGTFGHFGVYSFNGNKIITSGGGGMLVSNNEEWIKKAKFLSTQAKEDKPWYEHKEIGFNYRISNILAAIGLAQLETIQTKIEKRRKIFGVYRQNLKDIADFMPEIPGATGNRWLTTVIFKEKNPIFVLRELEKFNIEARPLWKPMHLQPVFRDAKAYLNGYSEFLFKKGLCLPSGSSMTYEEVETICDIIKKI